MHHMTKVTVSPLSKKILLKEYPHHEKSETIVISTHSHLYRQLMAKYWFNNKRSFKLTSEINIICASRIKVHNIEDAGLIIHQEHQMALMRWIQAAVAGGNTASHGIRTFYDHYELDHDELNMETVFRRWQRYVRKNIDLLQRPKHEILNAKIPNMEPPVFDEIKFSLFISEIIWKCYTKTGNFNYSLVRNIRLYIQTSGIPTTIAASTHLKPMSTWAAISRIGKWMDKHPDVRSVYLKYYGEHAASSQYVTGS